MLGMVELTKPFDSRYGPLKWDGMWASARKVNLSRWPESGWQFRVTVKSARSAPIQTTAGGATPDRLVSYLANEIFQRGSVPFLHVRAENATAIALYEKLNFRQRCKMGLLVFNH